MKLQKKVIIFGAGKKGEKLLDHLGESNVKCFCDNYKAGGMLHNKNIIDFQELIKGKLSYRFDVILSTDKDEIKRQLKDAEIPYWESVGITNNFFNQETVKNILDKELWEQYSGLENYKGSLNENKNWFRTSFISDVNKQLVMSMKCGNNKLVSKILSKMYDGSNEGKIHIDEYFANRPGMRLISKIIEENRKGEIKICDLASGHGDFLMMLKSNYITCYGVDISVERCRVLQSQGIECNLCTLENSEYENEIFDYVTMMECLEHVKDPIIVLEEAKRILKRKGWIFVTVPNGTCCDSDMHVRHFYENDLYSIAKECGYSNIKVMRLPYLNWTYNDNLLLSAEKIDYRMREG